MYGGGQQNPQNDQKSNCSGLNFNMLAGMGPGSGSRGVVGTNGPSPVSGLSGNDASRKAFSGIEFSDKKKKEADKSDVSLEFNQ